MEKCSQRDDNKEDLQNEEPTNDLFIGDSWFGSIISALYLKNKELIQHEVDSITQVKNGHARYPKAFLEETMAGWPGGTHLVLEGEVEGQTMFAVGYKYSKKKCLCFLFSEGASHTEPGEAYVAKYLDENDNSCSRDIDRPECCSKYFKYSNVIDVHNQQRQKELRLEKHWVTEDGYFQIFTTIFGVCVVDVWYAYLHHLPKNVKHRHVKCSLMDVVNMLAKDLLENEESKEAEVESETELCIGLEKEIDLNCENNFSQVSEITMTTQTTIPNNMKFN